MNIQVVILAAGQGKRMYSNLPKVLHPLAGKPLLEHVLATASLVAPKTKPIVVFGHQGDIVQERLQKQPIHWVEQKEQAGTGHAVQQALPVISDDTRVLILYGDVPLISKETLERLLAATPKDEIGMLTATLANPTGYGRIIRDSGQNIVGIVEEKDATPAERAIHEINPGIYVVPATLLKKWLPTLKNHNAQNEYYLTDIISLAVQNKIKIHAVQPALLEEIAGVNDRLQLAVLERFYQKQIAEKLLRQGVTLLDPARLDVRGDVEVGRDVTIDVNVILEGRVVIGDGCVIGPNALLRNVVLGQRVEIKANSVLEDADIGDECVIGPFARLRPEVVLAEKVHIGNFVEVKKSHVGAATKINHLSYVGDADIGVRVNIGAGTITCNYDGANKNKTKIEDDVHIGSDTQLIAPVTVGAGATIGAGSTVAKDVPAHELTITHRLEQRVINSWKRPKKQ